MTFSVEFYAASAESAEKALAAESNLPQCVRDFLAQSLKAVTGPVYVKAFGHLYNGDYTTSSAQIEVRPFIFHEVKS